MDLQQTPAGERPHIAFFGRCNAGKSSVINAVTAQNLSVVSPVRGTTTDPVRKAMELLPVGPVLFIDTPGLDDAGNLGKQRMERTKHVLAETDLAVLVVDAVSGFSAEDAMICTLLEKHKVPYLLAYNKCDFLPEKERKTLSEKELYISAASGEGIPELKQKMVSLCSSYLRENPRKVIADLVQPGDVVVLVMPIDASAPKGRLILPQQQTLRELLETGCTAVCCQDTDLQRTLRKLSVPPFLVVTDSQAFERVAQEVAPEQPMTSFSILFARYKGDLATLTAGARKIRDLQDGDRVLLAEGCTHHRQCGDIGSVKIPSWIRQFTGKQVEFSFTSGVDFPKKLDEYALLVHCGGCMLNEAAMRQRMEMARKAGVPMVNYGIAIAYMHGVLHRSLAPFPQIQAMLYE